MPVVHIPPIVLADDEIEQIQSSLPLLPADYRKTWSGLGLDRSVVESLLDNRSYAEAVTAVLGEAGNKAAARVAHWFASAVEAEATDAIKVGSIDRLVELANMVEESLLSSTAAKQVFNQLLTTDQSPREIAEAGNLLQVSDESAIAAVVDAVLSDPASQKSIEDIKAGKDKAIGYLVGQVMKQSKGKANPAIAQKLIRERL